MKKAKINHDFKQQEKKTEEEEEEDGGRDNSNSKTLFYNDCSLGLVKNLSNN